jgi:hypothetical protein
MKKNLPNKTSYLLKLLKKNVGKILLATLFFSVVLVFSLFLLRQDQYVYVRLYLTEREESKHWLNFPDSYYYQNVRVGLQEKNELGSPVAEVVDVFRVNTTYQHEPALVLVKVKANLNKSTGVYSFQGQPLMVGEFQRFKIGSLKLQGYVLDVNSEQVAYKEKKYTVRAILDDVGESNRGNIDTKVMGVPREVAQALKKGDLITDSHGNVVAEINTIAFNPAQRTAYTAQGKTTYIDTDLVSGEVELTLRTIELDGVDYWDFVNPMQVNQRLVINFQAAQLPVKIVEIVSVEEV